MAVLIDQAEGFAEKLRAIREQQPPAPGKQWYLYNSLNNLKRLSAMLSDGHRASITSFIPNGRIADIGCGDGDLGLFFASLGCKVDLIDTPAPSQNEMMGVRTLRNALDIGAGIIEADLEGRNGMLDKYYDFAFVLGLLYHLKNPYLFLDRLAKRVSMIVLSTKVTSYATLSNGERVCPEGLPLGYLIGAGECNNDDTNYWTFTSAGLRRLFERTRDTPETYWSRCNAEREAGKAATAPLKELLETAEVGFAPTSKSCKWRRECARRYFNGEDVANIMIREGHAVPYNGRGPRQDWCAQPTT